MSDPSPTPPQRAMRFKWLFPGVRPVDWARIPKDLLAGVTLAAMNIPQVLGYTRIAGTPVVTGLYTLLLPVVGFAAFGSSRYLVVAADSATAAILAGGLAGMAPPGSDRYVALAGLVALLSGALLLVARLLKLGFIADFLSQTVLVGFLTGVGFQVGIAVLGEMLGIRIQSRRTVGQLVEVIRLIPNVNLAALGLSAAVVVSILAFRRYAPVLPGPLLVVVGAIAASAAFDFAHLGIPVVGAVAGGLPVPHLPDMSLEDARRLMPVAGSCVVMIVAQSAATARAYAVRHQQPLDENADLLGLAAANAGAALTGTFVVDGSPTQTAMVERSGGRSQMAHLAAAGVVALVLLLFTHPLQYLPQCVLGAVVFTIAIGLIRFRALLDIRRESPGEFALASGTAATVVVVGVEEGIMLAMTFSLLRIVHHSYRPHTAVMIRDDRGEWRGAPVTAGARTEPGVVVYRFGAPLFYANANRFAEEVCGLAGTDPKPKWFIVDAGPITRLDYTAARYVSNLQSDLAGKGVRLAFAHVGADLRADLDRHNLTETIGRENLFDTLHEAMTKIHGRD
jgi:SulP family sulfate permease